MQIGMKMVKNTNRAVCEHIKAKTGSGKINSNTKLNFCKNCQKKFLKELLK